MDILNLTPKQLRQAADLQERIESLQSQLSQILGGVIRPQATSPAPAGKRQISAAGRARIAAAARARWARVRKQKAAAAGTPAPKRSRKLGPAARARLAALARERWAKARKEGRSRL